MAVYCCEKEQICFFNSTEVTLQQIKSADMFFSTHPMEVTMLRKNKTYKRVSYRLDFELLTGKDKLPQKI